MDGQRAQQLSTNTDHRQHVDHPQVCLSTRPPCKITSSWLACSICLTVEGEAWPSLLRPQFHGLLLSRWCEPPNPAAVNIVLEPGLAFGTGEHPTTRLCLRALSCMPLSGTRVMDYGTGVRILRAQNRIGSQQAVVHSRVISEPGCQGKGWTGEISLGGPVSGRVGVLDQQALECWPLQR